MAKRTVYICDGKDCGAVLVNAEDGFITVGTIKTTALDGEPKVLVTSAPVALEGAVPAPPGEAALCKECMAKALGFPFTP
jgi:hypothetical protein